MGKTTQVGRWKVNPLMAALAAGILFLGLSPALARRISDRGVTLFVETVLMREESVSWHLIDVHTKEGIVTLSGSVDNILAKERAASIAGRVKGVRSVLNNLTVEPVPRSDGEVYEDMMRALLEDPATEVYEVSPQVKDGVVTLTGTVDSWQEKRLCEQVAKGVKGVRDIQNKIEVAPRAKRSDTQIEADIKSRLDWDVWVDDALLTVDVKNGEVKLSGKVGSAAEKSRAFIDAWVPGVKAVDHSGLEVDWSTRDALRRYTPRSDGEIERAIKDAFRYDPRVSPFSVEVIADYGVATLTGVVDNLKARRAAEEVASNTAGVWRVKNRLRVRPPDGPPAGPKPLRFDTAIAEKVRAGLARDPYVEQHEISVLVSNHGVVLNGTVDSQYEKLRAEDVASRVQRVVAVRNNLSVRDLWTEKDDWEIKEDVEDELWWSPYVDSDEVVVTVQDGVVALVGVVDRLRDRRMATENAYEGGARKVRNYLKVRNGPPHLRP
jgi:osmotically-inducible protein OsmY